MYEYNTGFEVRQDGSKFYILNTNTGWESDRFAIQDLLVLKSGMNQTMKNVFNLRIVLGGGIGCQK